MNEAGRLMKIDSPFILFVFIRDSLRDSSEAVLTFVSMDVTMCEGDMS
jgi:hypothetical protein